MKLSEILNDLNLDIDSDAGNAGNAGNQGNEGGGNQGNEFKLESIPEEHREAVKKALEAVNTKVESLTNESAKKDLVNQTLQQALEAAQKSTQIQGAQGNQTDTKIFGLEESDVYYNQFKGMKNQLDRIEGAKRADDTTAWNTMLGEMVKTHPDMAVVANDMDKIVAEHPTMSQSRRGMELAYKLAKEVHENRETLKGDALEAQKRAAEAAGNATELGGISTDIATTGGAKTVEEAFEKAQTQLAKGKK